MIKLTNYMAMLVALFALAFTFSFVSPSEASAGHCSVRVDVLDGITLAPVQGVLVSYAEDTTPYRGYETFGYTNNLGQTGISNLFGTDYYFRIDQAGYNFTDANGSNYEYIACDDSEAFYLTFFRYPV